MADDKASKGASFLKRSKWGKIFKEDDSPAAAGRQGSFKLNEDVADFLKPSTEKSVPKIDIAIAKRWPGAHEVQVADTESMPAGGRFVSRPPRQRGLMVGFVNTEPEIIGEGGDESDEPTAEISRRRIMGGRSGAERRVGSIENAEGAWGMSNPRRQDTGGGGGGGGGGGDNDFEPTPLRRVHTSHYESSPAMQRKHASPPMDPPEPGKPVLGRTPTGFSMHEPHHETPIEVPVREHFPQEHRQDTRSRPWVDTHVENRRPAAGSALLTPASAESPVVRMQREMRSNEGMAFRRASMLAAENNDDEDDEDEIPVNTHNKFQRPPQPNPTLSAASSHSTSSPSGLSPLDSNRSPRSGTSPARSVNPFADPKYIKRHSGEAPPAPRAAHQLPPQPKATQAAPSQSPTRRTGASNPYAFEHDPDSSPEQMRRNVPEEIHQPSIQTQDAHEFEEQSPPQAPPSQQRPPRIYEPPSYMRAGAGNAIIDQREPTLPDLSQVPASASSRPPRDDTIPSYMRNVQPQTTTTLPTRPAQTSGPSQTMNIPMDASRSRSHSRGERDPSFDSSSGLEQSQGLYARPNGSSSSMNPPVEGGLGPNSMASRSVQNRQPGLQPHPPPSPRSYSDQRPGSSRLNPNRLDPPPGSNHHNIDPYGAPRPSSARREKSPLLATQQHERGRSSSSHSQDSNGLSASLAAFPIESNPATDAAFEDFAGRVAHMKGVFRLTAEKEMPHDRWSPSLWLRTAFWWYLVGKAGLEGILKQRARDPTGAPREMLVQGHVDLAKAWWILVDPLQPYESSGVSGAEDFEREEGPDIVLRKATAILRGHLQSLCLSLGRSDLLPPTQSLIQGQNTQILLPYPRFSPRAAAALGGNVEDSLIDPYDFLPLGDTREVFCYGRNFVDVYVNTDEPETDRVVLPCILSLLRNTRDYRTSIVIASQSNLVNIRITPQQNERHGLTWDNVSWRASSQGMSIHLPHGFELSVRMQERDFRSVWQMCEFTRQLEQNLQAGPDEILVHEAHLAELQYADPANPHAFPSGKVRGCMGLFFEKLQEIHDADGIRKAHRGFRMLLVTDPGTKTLSSVGHEVSRTMPLFFEFLTDSAANGTTAMILTVREKGRDCKTLLVFPDMGSRQALYDVLNGLTVAQDETIVGKMALSGLSIDPAWQVDGEFSPAINAALQGLQWQKLGVTNTLPDDDHRGSHLTIESASLRILARHSSGCITDRLNLAKGEMLFRLPCSNSTSVHILREPQQDLTISIDTRSTPPRVADGLSQLLQHVHRAPTVRTFTFASLPDLHAFETAITGFDILYDGIAATLSIARRRMVVPIYKKWEATKVRVQIVTQENVVRFVAFMEGFSHADALCMRLMGSDDFEHIKHGVKYGVKLVDAKFSLPAQEKAAGEEEMVRRRFVNLEGLEYAEEHDDVTVEFDGEAERDRFARALPAETSVSRGITLKRRI